ncbi:unnamed protein product [Clonostachys rhizophaga]|uniref:Uncharacterized protein n=1 Tax=Clonostachys rhizophaga TaxID=160324 RepID=A0A9N9V677_9HYPO|nr:unnamed protein product [Clonostachys rhizophaga]
MDSNSDHFPDSVESKSKFQLGYEALRFSEGIKQRIKEHGDEMRRIATAEDNVESPNCLGPDSWFFFKDRALNP